MSLSLSVLGSPRLELNGVAIELERRKSLALLVYLAVTGVRQSRDVLAALLWPDQDQAQARASVRRALAGLNASLGTAWLDADRDTLAVQTDTLWLDLDAFHAQLVLCATHGHAADEVCPACLGPLTAAVDLYRGDFLAGFAVRDCAEFEEWQFFQAETYRREVALALAHLTDGLSRQGDHAAAIPYARRWLALDPLHEPAHQALMRLYAWTDQRTAALRQYAECERILQHELGVAPQAATTELYQAIVQGRFLPPALRETGSRGEVTALLLPTAPLLAGNLPMPTTPLLGRSQELARLAERLADPATRLITLVGPGGVGKTRLALQVAADHTTVFPDGVVYVALVGAASTEQFISTLAGTLGIALSGRCDPVAEVASALGHQRVLLVLDNFEHLIDSAPRLADLLAQTAQVCVLVTSRTRLNLQGEWVVELDGLTCPPEGATDMEQYAAVQLFMDSARRVKADFQLTPADRSHVARICRLIGGLPLALEMAAAWVRVLTPAEIANEVARSLDFLTSPRRDAPARQQSLRAIFDSSWARLTDAERDALRRLAVFCGGFNRQAAEQVADAALPLLVALADQSLVRRCGPSRFDLHMSLQAFAQEKLDTAPDHALVNDRHAVFYTRLLDEYARRLAGPDRAATTREITLEIDNIRHAWDWAVEHRHFDTLGLALEDLFRIYELWGWFREGEALLADTSTRLADAPRRLRARFLARWGAFSSGLSRYAEARALFDQALGLLDADDSQERAFILGRLGETVYSQGDYAQARPLFEQCIALSQAAGLTDNLARPLNSLGYLAADLGEYAAARTWFEQALDYGRAAEAQRDIASSYSGLGYTSLQAGEYDAARIFLTKSLALRHSIGDRYGVATDLSDLGAALAGLGETGLAEGKLREALGIAREVGAQSMALDGLVYLAALRAQAGDVVQALTWLGVVQAHPASWIDTRARARGVLAELTPPPTPDQVATAQTRAQLLRLEDVLAEVVAA